GRWEEALGCYRRAKWLYPIAPPPIVAGNEFNLLLALDRPNEADTLVQHLTPITAREAPMELAVVRGDWRQAESLARGLAQDVGLPPDTRVPAAWVVAVASARRGRVTEADTLLA